MKTQSEIIPKEFMMTFENWVTMIVFADEPAKWKLETLKKGILERRGIKNENTRTS